MPPIKKQSSRGDVHAILAERQKTHGSFTTHAAIAQAIKAVYHAAPGWAKLDDDMKESLEMIAHKQARLLNGNPDYADNWVDICGYSQLVVNRLEADLGTTKHR